LYIEDGGAGTMRRRPVHTPVIALYSGSIAP
jgi:hypothetical protein